VSGEVGTTVIVVPEEVMVKWYSFPFVAGGKVTVEVVDTRICSSDRVSE
jgi:hypothetical protein